MPISKGFSSHWKSWGRRTSLPQESRFAVVSLQENYAQIKNEFDEFFKELIRFVEFEFGIKIERPFIREPLFDMNEA